MAQTIPTTRPQGTDGVGDLPGAQGRALQRELDRPHESARARKPTVLLCGPPASAVGGGPTHIRNMFASPLAQKFNLVHFECGSRGAESPAKDEPTTAKLIRLLTSPFVLAARIIKLRPQVVHINSALDHKAFWRDCVYLVVCKLFGARVVFQLHGGSIELLCVNRIVRKIVRFAFSLPDAVVLLASVELQQFAKEIGMRERISVIPNAVDVSEYGPAERPHSGQIRHLGFLARLIRSKGVFESIQAVNILRREQNFGDIELRIAGSGPEFEALERHIREQGLDKWVKLIGPIYGRAKVDFLRQIDVLLFPTYHLEGLPYSILESLAAGAPIITTRVGGIPDVVADGVHGILIDSHAPSKIVRALHDLAESPQKLREMSKDCREWAAHGLGLDRLARQFGEIYDRVSGITR
jgi:glycosyltransferase involved in cell wall biosynthesis